MSSWASPGVKCVCRKRGEWIGKFTGRIGDGPKFGQVCQIVAVRALSHGTGIQVAGYGDEWFSLRRFRPLITRSQEDDVAIFRKLLVPEGVDA